ncbi:MAG TPA: pilin [Candidatus Portnoybacteria bacterium]|nr:pilin [Candidatus Portnoybacteria bacterium]
MNKNIFKKILVPCLVIGFAFFVIWPVEAAGLLPNCRAASCTPCHFLQLISNVLLFVVKNIVAPLAGLLFLIGGIMMVSAGGSEERFKKGKEMFKNVAIGVLIILASWAIVNTLITTFGTSVDGFVPGNWWRVNCL